MRTAGDLEIRRGRGDDLPEVLGLLRDSLGWEVDPRYEALYAWKHRESPFGPSAIWVAFDGERLAGLRVLMRWEFERHRRVVRAVRAVDTATHPAYRGRGVFSRLTLHALDELHAEGVSFVFNTPNEQSRPGYLKMGWSLVGRLPLAARPTSMRGLTRMARARVPAERWSVASTTGAPAKEILQQRASLERLLGSRAGSSALRTHVTPEYLAWRYGSPLVEYRALAHPGGLDRGLVIFRTRRRGAALETVVGDVLVPGDEQRLRDDLIRRVARATEADYTIAIEPRWASPAALVRLPRQGPILTWRALSETQPPTLREWDLHLGDVELF